MLLNYNRHELTKLKEKIYFYEILMKHKKQRRNETYKLNKFYFNSYKKIRFTYNCNNDAGKFHLSNVYNNLKV